MDSSINNIRFSDTFINSNDMFSNMNEYERYELIYKIFNTKYTLRNKLNLGENIKFGTEIEFRNAPNKVIEKYILNNYKEWHMQSERTTEIVKNKIVYGGEVTSPILTNKIKTWKDLKTICKYIRDCGGKSKNTGAHIHYDNSIIGGINYNNLYDLTLFWIMNEPVIYRFSTGRDYKMRDNYYKYADCLFENMLYGNLNIEKNIENNINNCIKFVTQSKCFGFSTYTDNKGTIEIRCPNGTLNTTIWQNNINFFAHFLQYIKNNNILLDYNEFMNFLKFYKKIDYFNNDMILEIDKALILADKIFNKNVDKIYFLKQYLKQNDYNNIQEKRKKKSIYI